MGALTTGEMASYLRQAGFSESEIPKMVAIGMAESGGNPRAHNPNAATGDDSYGWLQINMRGGLGPERRQQLGLRSNEELFDAPTNARAAKAIYDSQGPNAWSVYKSGAYKRYLDQAQSQTAAPVAASSPQQPDWLSMILGGGKGGGLQMPALVAPLAAAAVAMPQLRSTGAPLAGYRLAGAAENPLSKAAQALVQQGPISMLNPEPLIQPQAAPAAAPAGQGAPVSLDDDGSGEALSLSAFGQRLQKLGLQVREHPDFGGVGKHSPNSWHYKGRAFDLTIQPGSPLLSGRPDSDWRTVKRQIGEELRQGLPGAEVYHPGYDPVGGHDSHIHLAVPENVVRLNPRLRRLLDRAA